MADKMLDRVSKLLNQAERAPEGSPEREAFMERAMVLSQAHSIDLAIARAHQAKKEQVEEPEKRSFKVSEIQTFSASKRAAHFTDLMLAITRANDVECSISHSRSYVFGVGMPSDLDLCEKLFTLLAPQMVAEADAALKRGDNKTVERLPKRMRVDIPDDERAWGGYNFNEGWDYDTQEDYWDALEWVEDLNKHYEKRGSDARVKAEDYSVNDGWTWREHKIRIPPKTKLVDVLDDDGNTVYEERAKSTIDGRLWRANFYSGFVTRTSQRLREAKKQALREAGVDMKDDTDPKALALVDKKKVVRDAYEEENKVVLATGRTYGGAEVGRVDYGAHSQGSEAGARAVHGNEKVVD